MSGVLQRLKLKQTPIDTWSLKEHLTLASAVLKNGDQNWVSVSRTMKQLGEAGRPSDWFKDKNCALQYNLLLEKADIPIRKRGDKTDSSESPAQRIVNTLAQERIAELRIILEEERLEILRLEEQTQLLSSEDTTEEELDVIMKEVEAEEAEEDAKEQQAVAWLQSREEKKLAIQTALKSGNHRARFGQMKATPGQSQSEQSGSEVDSAVESPVVDSLDSDSQQVDVESVATTTIQAPPVSGLETPHSVSPSSRAVPRSLSPSLDPASVSPPVQSPNTATSPLLTSLLQSPTRQQGLHNFPIKCAAISNLAQKLASPVAPFHSPGLPPVIMGSSQEATQSNLNLGKADDVDLKETLSDLDELLKKELEGDLKETKEESVEVVTEAEIEIKVESETEDNSIVKIDAVESVPTDMVEFDNTNDEKNDVDELENKSSIKRPGRPKKATEVLKFKQTASGDEEEVIVNQDMNDQKEDNDMMKPFEPESPLSRPTSPPLVEVTAKIVSDDVESKNEVDTSLTEVIQSSAPPTPEISEEEVSRQAWRVSAHTAIDMIINHRNGHLFARPVTDAEAPEYRDIIYRPMDLGSIRSNLESGHIQCTQALLRDLNLVFLNAIMYNSSDNELYTVIVEMQADANRIVREIVLAQGGKTPPLVVPLLDREQRGRSVSGSLGGESPVSSRSRTVSSSGVEERRKRERTSSVAEEGVAKKRRLRNIEEN